MPLRSALPVLASVLLLAACGDPAPGTPADAGLDGSGGGGKGDDGGAPACDVTGLTAAAPVPVDTFSILPSATAQKGETIDDTLQGQLKKHLVKIPTRPADRNGLLFVWLSGSGAEPTQYDSILAIANAAGYLAVSLAYDNETSVVERCSVMGDAVCGVANEGCDEDVRLEMIYGSAVHDSKCVDVSPANAIEHRILRLIQFAAANNPGSGASAFLTAGGTAIDWSKVAIGGWSQGGGHSGLIARDHLVARAIYASKGSGQTYCQAVFSDSTRCDLDGDGMLTNGNDDELYLAPRWTLQPRKTPGSRQFGVIHGMEKAWAYSREAFENFGMGRKGTEVDIDAVGSDFAAFHCGHSFVSRAAPACEPHKTHESMAIDACLARDAKGGLVLAPFYYYALKVAVPQP